MNVYKYIEFVKNAIRCLASFDRVFPQPGAHQQRDVQSEVAQGGIRVAHHDHRHCWYRPSAVVGATQ